MQTESSNAFPNEFEADGISFEGPVPGNMDDRGVESQIAPGPTTPSQPPGESPKTHEDIDRFRKYVLRRILVYTVVALGLWFSFLRSAMPLVIFGFIVGTLGSIAQFWMHVAAIEDQLTGVSDGNSGASASGSMFRFFVGAVALIVVGAVARGELVPVIAGGIGLMMYRITLIIEGVRGKLDNPPDPDDPESDSEKESDK